MARKAGKSRTAMSEATGGDHLPTWDTVAAFVAVCGARPDDWRRPWEEARDRLQALKGEHPPAEKETRQSPTAAADEATPGEVTRLRPNTVVVAAAVVVTTVVIASVIALSMATAPGANPAVSTSASPSGTGTPVVVVVQNMVALGGSGLVEDSTPVYLSTQAVPSCGKRGCKIDDTEMWSGAVLKALCQLHGEPIHNYNLDSPEAASNPDRAKSDLWYRVELPDGRSGLIAESYIQPSFRGGLGLPLCPTPTG